MISSGCDAFAIAVEPRRSENHSTALIRSVTPREMRPRSTCSDGIAPEIDPAERRGRCRPAARTSSQVRAPARDRAAPPSPLAESPGRAASANRNRRSPSGRASRPRRSGARSRENAGGPCPRDRRSGRNRRAAHRPDRPHLVMAVLEHVRNTERRQFSAASPSPVEPYSKLSLSLARSRSSESRGPRRPGATCR